MARLVSWQQYAILCIVHGPILGHCMTSSRVCFEIMLGISKCGGTSKQISVGAYWIYWNLLVQYGIKTVCCRSKDHFHWTAPCTSCTPLVPKVGGHCPLQPPSPLLRRPWVQLTITSSQSPICPQSQFQTQRIIHQNTSMRSAVFLGCSVIVSLDSNNGIAWSLEIKSGWNFPSGVNVCHKCISTIQQTPWKPLYIWRTHHPRFFTERRLYPSVIIRQSSWFKPATLGHCNLWSTGATSENSLQ